MALAEQAGNSGCKVLPGKLWGLHYPENGTKRARAIQALLEGTMEAKAAIHDLRPDALIYDAEDIEKAGLPAVSARIRAMTASVEHTDYAQFAEFVSRMQGKEVDAATVEQLYEGIASSRLRQSLFESYGHTGQQQLKTALQADAKRIEAALPTITGMQRITEALKLGWLQSEHFTGPDAVAAIGQLRPAEAAVVDALAGQYREYVKNGDDAAYEALVSAIEAQLPAIERVEEQPSQSMEQLQEELEQFKDQATPPGDPSDPAIPPDDEDEYHTPPPGMPNEGDEGGAEQQRQVHFEISPSGTSKAALVGYYRRGSKSYYDAPAKTWSKKKQVVPYDTNIAGDERQTIRGTIDAGLKALPIPLGYALDAQSLNVEAGDVPEFFRDQTGCFYVKSTGGPSRFSIDFLQESHRFPSPPIAEDSQPLHHGALSTAAEQMLTSLSGSDIDRAQQICSFVRKSHFYPGGGDLQAAGALQWKLRQQNSGDTYLPALDASEYLECYSSNTLFVHLCRRAGIPARLVTGDKIDSAKNGKACIDSNTGHAWAEVWDGVHWRRMDGTPPAKPEDKKKKKKDDQQQQDQSTPSTEADDGGIDGEPDNDITDEMQDRVDQQMQSVQQNSQQQPSDSDVQEAEQHLEDAREKIEKMKERLNEFREQAKRDKTFEDLEKTRQEAQKEGLLPEDQEALDKHIEAKKNQMKNDMKEHLDNMQKDGFLDESKREQLEQQMSSDDARELDALWNDIESQGSLHAEFESIREDVAPLVDQWYRYFHDRLPRKEDPEVDTDSRSRRGAFDRRAIKNPRNLLFGTVRNPRILRSSHEPRFLASFWMDVSGSMQDKLDSARKLLVFYCELFSRISEEFGYIRFSAQTFSDSVTPIKTFDHDYHSAERYSYADGASTVKARLMTHLHTTGGTNMLDAVQEAARQIHAELRKYPDYAAAFYLVGDGDDTCGNSKKVRELLNADESAMGLGNVMRSAVLLGEERHRQQLAGMFGDENTTVAGSFEELVEQSMLRFDEQIERYLERLQ